MRVLFATTRGSSGSRPGSGSRPCAPASGTGGAGAATPHHATLLTGITVAILAGFVPIGVAAELTNIGTLFAFTLVCLAVLVARRIRPELKRPFRTPFVPAVPVLGMLACLGIMSFLPAITWLGFFSWMLFGLVLYFVYGFRHSRQAARHPAVRASQPPWAVQGCCGVRT